MLKSCVFTILDLFEKLNLHKGLTSYMPPNLVWFFEKSLYELAQKNNSRKDIFIFYNSRVFWKKSMNLKGPPIISLAPWSKFWAIVIIQTLVGPKSHSRNQIFLLKILGLSKILNLWKGPTPQWSIFRQKT